MESGAKAQAGTKGARKVVLAALAGNLAIAVTKFVAFAITGSSAILTEGIHSLVDTADQGLLLVGQARAARPATESHPFGYGMETYFWSFIVALMIFLVGGVVAVWQGVHEMQNPEPIAQPLVSVAVLSAAALFEGLSFRTAYREYRAIVRGRDVRLMGFLKGSKDPNVFATLLEDGAALAGLTIAACGVAASVSMHVLWADGAASVLIGLLLIAVAIFLANETRSLIAGEAAAPPIEAAVQDALARADPHGQVTRLRTLHLGPQSILVAVGWRIATKTDNAPTSPEAARAELARLEACVRGTDARITEVLFEIVGDGVSSAPGSLAGGTAR
jgi:cation diffusion facilitator family transporter